MTNERLKQAAELFYEKILQKKYAEATLRNYHQRIHSLLRYCDSKSLEAFSYDEAETYSYWLCERVDRGEIKDKYAGFLRNFALAFADFNSIPMEAQDAYVFVSHTTFISSKNTLNAFGPSVFYDTTIKRGINLFNKNDARNKDGYYRDQNGALVQATGTGLFLSHPIAVKAGVEYSAIRKNGSYGANNKGFVVDASGDIVYGIFDCQTKTNASGDTFIAFTPEKITFTVATKLIYPHDVRELLMKKYNSVFNFNNISLDKNTPVKNFYVSEKNSVGLKNPDTSDIYFNWVICEQCGPTDVVVDKNLNQIWPKTTGTFPQTLLRLLSKTTEKVH